MIVGLSGLIKSGKDEAGRILVDYFKEQGKIAKIVKMADAIKDIVCIITGLTREQIEDRDLKEKSLGPDWECWKYENELFLTKEDAIKELKRNYSYLSPDDNDTIHALINTYIKKFEVTPRLLLTTIGTDCGRNMIHPNMWVNTTFNNYTDDEIWIITDIRFPNEIDAIEKRKGTVIRIERNNEFKFPIEWESYSKRDNLQIPFIKYLHDSNLDLYKIITAEPEISLNNYHFKNVIQNNTDLDYLKNELIKIVNEHYPIS